VAILEEAGQLERAIELLLGANEPTDALGAISRGGETQFERCDTDRLESRHPPILPRLCPC